MMLSFTFQGQAVPFQEDDTFASALARTGVLDLRRSLKETARGLYCGIGLCFECEILVDGIPARACIIPAREASVERGRAWREVP